MDRLASMRALVAKQPGNPLIRFGLANELLKAGLIEEAVAEMELYLADHDDEGNGWLRYADALHALGRPAKAHDAAQLGLSAARRHGHQGLVAEFEEREY